MKEGIYLFVSSLFPLEIIIFHRMPTVIICRFYSHPDQKDTPFNFRKKLKNDYTKKPLEIKRAFWFMSTSYLFTASLKVFPAENFGTFLAAILIVAPV